MTRAMRADLVEKSRSLARVLRHRPDIWGVSLDKAGWCTVDELLAGAAEHGVLLDQEELLEIVQTNDKARYTISEDGKRIRAAQGHSISVELNLQNALPPPLLYHGTVERFLAAIKRKGLLPMKRHAVHLSATKEAAIVVARRRGNPEVLAVDSASMHRDGWVFQVSDNGVWLVNEVPSKYLSQLPDGTS